MSVVAAAALLWTVAGCGDAGKKDADSAGATKPRLAIIFTDEFRDGSWAESALTGAQKLKDAGVISDFVTQEHVAPGAAAERALRGLAEQGYNPIVAHSFPYGDDVKKVAKDFPRTLFAYAGAFGDVKDNVTDYSEPFHEATYLEGILGAGVSSGAVAGASGFDIPVCRAMYNAYLEGAKLIRPATTGTYVAVGDWVDVQKAKEVALSQADKGATMFVSCGQGPMFGQIEAAKERKGVAAGYVGDMSSRGDAVLVSFTWNLDKWFALMVADVAAGKVNPSQYYQVSMKDGGLDIVINPSWRSRIPAEVLAIYEQKLAGLKNGSLSAPFNDK